MKNGRTVYDDGMAQQLAALNEARAAEISAAGRSSLEQMERVKPVGPKLPKISDLPMLMQEIIIYYKNMAQRYNPEYEIMTALGVMSMLAAGGYQHERSGTRTHLQGIFLGPTGCGKEDPRKIFRAVAEATERKVIEKVASGAALEDGLLEHGALTYMPDEYGLVLKAALGGGALHDLQQMVLESYSAAQTKAWKGRALVSRKDVEPVAYPSLSVFGSSTASTLTKALSSAESMSGLLPRSLIVRVDETRERNRPTAWQPHNELVLLLRPWRFAPNREQSVMVREDGAVDAQVYEEIDQLFRERQRTLEGLGDLWSRAGENASKVAMLIAIAENREAPIVTLEIAELARDIVLHSCQTMHLLADREIADSDFERLCKTLLDYIREASTRGDKQWLPHTAYGWTPYTAISRKYKQDAREIDAALNKLEISGWIVEAERQGAAGPTVRCFKAAEE